MMIVPDAANMPPTPWQTEILAPGIWAGATPCIWRTLSCSAYMPECMQERPPPLVLSGSLPPGALGRDQDQRAAAIGHETALQQPERVGDHPRVQHILDGDRRPGVGPPGPAARGSRAGSSPPIRAARPRVSPIARA